MDNKTNNREQIKTRWIQVGKMQELCVCMHDSLIDSFHLCHIVGERDFNSEMVVTKATTAPCTNTENTTETTMDFVKDLDNRLLFAVPKKGRLYEECLQLLHGSDIHFNRKSRQDIALSTNLPIALIFLPAADIPKYVAEGNVDLGITGQDMVVENEVEDKVTEKMKLGFGKCRLCVQVPTKGAYQTLDSLVGKRIVTSFDGYARKIFEPLDQATGKTTTISYVSGSVEAACALGLADGISKYTSHLLIPCYLTCCLSLSLFS